MYSNRSIWNERDKNDALQSYQEVYREDAVARIIEDLNRTINNPNIRTPAKNKAREFLLFFQQVIKD